MVSAGQNPGQGFYFSPSSSGMSLPGVGSLPPAPVSGNGSPAEEQGKKVRKPYTITKSRESWTDEEHDKFLEALQLFDRDWKKIEAFVGSKTVIQIRSHAQKYFLKVQKSGSNERVPPPRPKRKAAHPYPQKASKIAAAAIQSPGQSLPGAVFEPRYVYHPHPSSILINQSGTKITSSWAYGSLAAVNSSNMRIDDAALAMPMMSPNCCCSSTTESTNHWPTRGALYQTNQVKHMKVMPDFAQVYSFIGGVFDPSARDHLQKLKRMDPINIETALLLMRNLSTNLVRPEFEEHMKLLSSYGAESATGKCSLLSPAPNSKTAIPAV